MGDQFSIATTTGTQGQGNSYAPFKSPLYYSDELSTATELSVGGYSAGPLSDSNLTLNWNVALDAAGGGTLQAITGGCHRPAYSGQSEIGIYRPLDDRGNQATA